MEFRYDQIVMQNMIGVMVFQGVVEIELGNCFEEPSSICVSFSLDASCSFPSDMRTDKL